MDRRVLGAAVHGSAELDMTERQRHHLGRLKGRMSTGEDQIA